MCGQMKGIVDVFIACSRVASSQMLAQLNSRWFHLSIKVSGLGVRHAAVFLRGARRDASRLVYAAVLFPVAVEAKQVALI
jgi:hypothetical protein